eukprot:GHVU01117656.1.p1 GENE.GHVU01117656.1~~GHVU01117656.1.p1  ORF type:complete len:167 (-),score=21.93 GHVU01117656.1:889-1389(-)
MASSPAVMGDSLPRINSAIVERHNNAVVCVLTEEKGRVLLSNNALKSGSSILMEDPLHKVQIDPENQLYCDLVEWASKQGFSLPPIWYWCALNSINVKGKPHAKLDALPVGSITAVQQEMLLFLFVPDTNEPGDEVKYICERLELTAADASLLESLLQGTSPCAAD